MDLTRRCVLRRFALLLFAVGSFLFDIRQVLAQTDRAPAIVVVCAPCHGVDGTTGNIETPNLAGQKAIYLRQQLLAFRDGRRKHPDMKTISRDLTEREINQLVIYYSTLVTP
jgi:cytochrome c553